MVDTMGEEKGGAAGGASHEEGIPWRTRRIALAEGLRRARLDAFGEDGAPELARRLGLPARTWLNYEAGVTVPAEVLLAFLDVTRVDPARLTGRGGHA